MSNPTPRFIYKAGYRHGSLKKAPILRETACNWFVDTEYRDDQQDDHQPIIERVKKEQRFSGAWFRTPIEALDHAIKTNQAGQDRLRHALLGLESADRVLQQLRLEQLMAAGTEETEK